MRKGFTLVELIIVVIVVGILATIAIPQYLRATERAKGAKAMSALAMISGGLKQSRAENDTYIGATLATINANFVELGPVAAGNDGDWTYTIPVATASTFTIQASRNAGSRVGLVIRLNESGQNTGTTWTP